MRSLGIPLLIAIAGLTACSGSSNRSDNEPSQAEPTIQGGMTLSQQHLFRGEIKPEDGQLYFSPCFSEQRFLLEHLPKGAQPEASRYIEVVGHLIGQIDNAGVTLKPDQWLLIAGSEGKNNCNAPLETQNILAVGQEPFWNLRSERDGLRFTTPDTRQYLRVASVQTKPGTTQYELHRSSDDVTGTLTFKQQACRDTAVGTYWQGQWQLQINQQILTGCGHQPVPAPTYTVSELAGSYHSVVEGTEIDLSLSSDYTAMMTYQITGSQSDIQETGYWYPGLNGQIHVLMTLRGHLPTLTEMHFTLSKNQLISEGQIINGVEFQFDQGPLVLDKMSQARQEYQATQGKRALQGDDRPGQAEPNQQLGQAIARYFQSHKTEPGNVRYSYSLYDLNGNDQLDAVVMLNWCQKKGCPLLIFERDQHNYNFVARYNSVDQGVYLTPKTNFGWHELEMCLDGQWQKLSFDGNSYPSKGEKTAVLSPTPRIALLAGQKQWPFKVTRQ